MRWILALLTGLVVAAALTGWGHEQQPAAGPPGGDGVRAVADLTREPAAPSRSADGTAALPGSSCSSPFGSTRYGFEAACRRHDRGYALLRDAARAGHPLAPAARRAIDRRFAADLAGECDSTGCLATAAVYAGAVRLNSWRQGDGVPVTENGWAAAGAGTAGAAAALLVALAGRRGPRLTVPVVTAGAALGFCLQATALPHPLWLQCLVGGLVTAQAYAAGGLVRRAAATVRRVREHRAGHRPRTFLVAPAVRAARLVAALRAAAPGAGLAALTAGLALAVDAAAAGHARVAASVGSPAPGAAFPLLALVGSAVLAAVLVAGGRALRRALTGAAAAVRAAAGRGRQRTAVAAAAVPLLLATGNTALPVFAPAATAAPGRVAVSTDPATWAVAGREGRRFLAPVGPGQAREATTPPTAVRPLRVYVPRDAAASAAERARLAVAALERSGGLDRAVVLVAVPTGSGWVNRVAPAALEDRRGGGVATVAVQYASSPSWLAYLRGGEGADESVRSLLAALRTALDDRQRSHPGRIRPRVLVYGESLGAWAGLRVSGDGQLPPGADGALWVGVPAGSRPSPSSPSSPPSGVVDDRPGDRGCRCVVALTHADDPVASWSPDLALRPSPAWRHRWLPVLSFWQATADLVIARSVPDGHGHHYGHELPGAWERVEAEAGRR